MGSADADSFGAAGFVRLMSRNRDCHPFRAPSISDSPTSSGHRRKWRPDRAAEARPGCNAASLGQSTGRTAIALRQIASLKSEIATFRRDLVPLRERVGKLEQTEKAKRESDQQEAADKSGTAANKPSEDNRTDQGGLRLSREEAELIRNYIKPALSTDITAPPINVGDAVSGATIPLPRRSRNCSAPDLQPATALIYHSEKFRIRNVSGQKLKKH
jgi:hypothetical protein